MCELGPEDKHDTRRRRAVAPFLTSCSLSNIVLRLCAGGRSGVAMHPVWFCRADAAALCTHVSESDDRKLSLEEAQSVTQRV